MNKNINIFKSKQEKPVNNDDDLDDILEGIYEEDDDNPEDGDPEDGDPYSDNNGNKAKNNIFKSGTNAVYSSEIERIINQFKKPF